MFHGCASTSNTNSGPGTSCRLRAASRSARTMLHMSRLVVVGWVGATHLVGWNTRPNGREEALRNSDDGSSATPTAMPYSHSKQVVRHHRAVLSRARLHRTLSRKLAGQLCFQSYSYIHATFRERRRVVRLATATQHTSRKQAVGAMVSARTMNSDNPGRRRMVSRPNVSTGDPTAHMLRSISVSTKPRRILY